MFQKIWVLGVPLGWGRVNP